MNLDRLPQTPQLPEYTPEQLQRCLQETDEALGASLKVLVKGMEVSFDPEIYKPWPKVEVKKSLASILRFFESKVIYYEGAGQSEKAKQAAEKVKELKNIFSEIDSGEEVPEGFLQTVQQAVEAEINYSDNTRGVSSGTEQPAPAEKTVERESSREKMNAIADLIDDLIQAYAKILRAKVEENIKSQQPESVKSARIEVLLPIIANLEKTQTAFLDAFNEYGALDMDEATLSDIIQATTDTGKKLEKIGF